MRTLALGIAIVIAILNAGCSTNPVSGRPELSPISVTSWIPIVAV
jgi:hypothetical protein